MRSRSVAVGALAVVVVSIAAWLWTSGDGIDELPGSQIRSPEVSIGNAESRRWVVLGDEAETNRPDIPRSLIALDTQICFGFERLDFGVPARPSVARCVERTDLESLDEDSIASIFVVKTGLDTWHVIAFGAPVDQIAVLGDDNNELAADRIFFGDGVVALRMPNDVRIESMSWTLGRARYRCEPAPDAVDSGRFCT